MELGRLRLAGIGADAVAVAGQLGEALSGLVGRHRSVVDLTADRPLKNGRVDEGGFGMRVARRVTARAIFDEHTLDAPACERRSHSSKPMRPRRASPNGTSERSSTRPPKYRASLSLTTSRGSPTAFR